jgi:hypothetical protein
VALSKYTLLVAIGPNSLYLLQSANFSRSTASGTPSTTLMVGNVVRTRSHTNDQIPVTPSCSNAVITRPTHTVVLYAARLKCCC